MYTKPDDYRDMATELNFGIRKWDQKIMFSREIIKIEQNAQYVHVLQWSTLMLAVQFVTSYKPDLSGEQLS